MIWNISVETKQWLEHTDEVWTSKQTDSRTHDYTDDLTSSSSPNMKTYLIKKHDFPDTCSVFGGSDGRQVIPQVVTFWCEDRNTKHEAQKLWLIVLQE